MSESTEIEAVARWAQRTKAAIASGVVNRTESAEFWRGYSAALDDLAVQLEFRAQRRAESDRGAADNFWLVLGSGFIALGALTLLFPVLVWPLVVFAAVWMVVAVVSIPFAVWLGRRIGGRP